MKDELFNTKEKIAAAIAAFSSLLGHPGWKLIEEIQEKNIKVARKQLEIGAGEGETVDDVDRARLKLKMYQEFKDTPNMFIKKLSSPKAESPVFDPFTTVEDVQARKKLATEEGT